MVTLYNPGPVAEQIRSSARRVRDLGMRSNRDLRALPKLRSLIAAGRYDVVHAHLFRSQVYARPAARLARTPVVVTTEHSIGETHIERRPMTRGVRGLYLASELFSDRTIAVSDVVRDRLVRWGVPARKITMIPNGTRRRRADLRRGGAQPGTGTARHHRRRRSCWARSAALDPNKRIDMVIEAAAPLLGERCALLIVGRGEGLDAAKAVAAQAGVADRVIFAGFQADTVAMLSAFDRT